MRAQDPLAVAAATSVDVDRWQAELEAVMARIGPAFARAEPRERVGRFVRGLPAGLSCTTCWSIAEHAGEPSARDAAAARGAA